MTSLPDINVWLALSFQSHVHHAEALEWFRHKDDHVAFCRITQQGLLRLSTNPKAFGSETLTAAEAWELFDAFLADSKITFVQSEPITLESRWREYTLGELFSPKMWTDAYLAAFAQAEDFELVTFDRGFTRFQYLKCNIIGS